MLFSVVAMMLMLAHAEPTLDERIPLQWQKNKVTEIRKFADECKKVLDEFGAETETDGARPKDVLLLKARFNEIRKKAIPFIESTNFDAQHRFPGNPFCINGIKSFQPVLEKLKQNDVSVMGALFGYNHSVLIGCAMTPKSVEAFQKLEEIRKLKAQQ